MNKLTRTKKEFCVMFLIPVAQELEALDKV